MTLSAIDRGWGNPDSNTFRRNIVSLTAGGVTVPVNKAVSDVFGYLNTRMALAYDLAGFGDDWGYCNRDVRGHPGVKSNHSWGLAEDLDAAVNPMTTDLKARHEFVRAVVDPILEPFEGRLVWGGEYASPRKDYMHFEYVGTPLDAVVDSRRAVKLDAAPTEDDDVTPADIEATAQRAAALTAVLIRKDLAVLLHGTKDGSHPANLDNLYADTQALRKKTGA